MTPQPTNTTEAPEAKIITIMADCLEEFEAALQKLVNKARRWGNPDISYRVVRGPYNETRAYDTPDGVGRKVVVQQLDIAITGGAPRIGDYKLVARLDPVPGSTTNMTMVAPGETLDPRFRDSGTICEHCKTRRQRKDVFVVEEQGTGKQLQVGRQCFKDFLGYDTPEGVAQRFTFWAALSQLEQEYDGDRIMRSEATYPLPETMKWTIVAVRRHGWMSGGQAQVLNERAERDPERYGYVDPTRHFVSFMMVNPTRPKDKYDAQKWDVMREACEKGDEAQAQELIAWVRTEMEGNDDYCYNLRTIFQQDMIFKLRHFGLAVSAVVGWTRARQRKLERQQQQDANANSRHFAQVGERVRGLKAAVAGVKSMGDRGFGETFLYKFRTDDGNVVTWFASNNQRLNTFDKVLLDGTVKECSHYQGVAETTMTRCKVEKVS